jgi:antitoxin PrlF
MECCNNAAGGLQPCCKVEAVISVDERGQMVLPKDIREKAGIHPGDKLALVSWGQGSGTPCLALIRVDDLSKMVQEMLGPVMKETFK